MSMTIQWCDEQRCDEVRVRICRLNMQHLLTCIQINITLLTGKQPALSLFSHCESRLIKVTVWMWTPPGLSDSVYTGVSAVLWILCAGLHTTGAGAFFTHSIKSASLDLDTVPCSMASLQSALLVELWWVMPLYLSVLWSSTTRSSSVEWYPCDTLRIYSF